MTDERHVTNDHAAGERRRETSPLSRLTGTQLFDRLQRLAAEFDNFRKRSAREQAAFAERANERLSRS